MRPGVFSEVLKEVKQREQEATQKREAGNLALSGLLVRVSVLRSIYF